MKVSSTPLYLHVLSYVQSLHNLVCKKMAAHYCLIWIFKVIIASKQFFLRSSGLFLVLWFVGRRVETAKEQSFQR